MPKIKPFLRAVRRNVSMVLFVGCVLSFVTALGSGFYLRGKVIAEQQFKDRLRDIAGVAAQQFDGDVVARIGWQESLQSADLHKLVHQLRQVRDTVPNIRYTYIMRKTEEPEMLQFVADATTFDTSEELDTDKNGKVDEYEEVSLPGDPYDVSELPVMQKDAFEHPSVDEEPTVDQWGSFISSYAPIRNVRGQTVAMLGMDVDVKDYLVLTRRIFSPVLFLLVFATSILFAGYAFTYLRNRQVEALQHIDDERSGLMVLASHQLGTPLTIFEWSLEALKESIDRDTLAEDLPEYEKNMKLGIGRIKDILDELHRASQFDEGRFAYKPERTYIRDTVVEAVHNLAPQLRTKKLKVTMEIDGNLQLRYDRTMIGSVLQELLRNAIEFSREKGKITVRTRIHRTMMEVEVRDEGCGIAKKDLGRIFGKFVRGANAHLSRPDGNGLGLFISKRIIERAGGEMWLESEEGKGTSVFFTLPMEENGK